MIKAGTEKVTEGKLNVTSNYTSYWFQTYLSCMSFGTQWGDTSPSQNPNTSLPPPFDSISPAHFIWRFSDNAQRIPFPNLPKNPPFIPTVKECMKGWHQAGEKKQGGKKRSSAHLGVKVVSLVLHWACVCVCVCRGGDRNSLRAQRWSLGQSPCKLSN